MFNSGQIADKSDSLIELLAAQCVDLEKLLSLARLETAAAKTGDFTAILDIVSERGAITARLETFQQQITNLRENLTANENAFLQTDVAAQIVEIANLTLAQDRKTKLLLTAARQESADGLYNLEKSQRGANAYLHGASKGLAYNQSF